jgi:predicted neutral ceramidase superfamily lipid hydrolase
LGDWGGIDMSDWSTSDVSIEIDPANELQKPPMSLLIATAVTTFCSLALIFVNSTAGYGLTVLASLLGGYTALVDQKRRGSSNYISYESFKNLLRLTRFSIVAIAVAHIVVLAIDAANGGGLF